jgi:hypothetical protein
MLSSDHLVIQLPEKGERHGRSHRITRSANELKEHFRERCLTQEEHHNLCGTKMSRTENHRYIQWLNGSGSLGYRLLVPYTDEEGNRRLIQRLFSLRQYDLPKNELLSIVIDRRGRLISNLGTGRWSKEKCDSPRKSSMRSDLEKTFFCKLFVDSFMNLHGASTKRDAQTPRGGAFREVA